MTKAVSILVLAVLACAVMPASASQEGVLAFGAFTINSFGIGESGPIVVSGRQGQRGVESLEVKAFGKVFALNAEQLRMLQGGLLNGLQLSYEGGYRELGGRTIYLWFSKGFTSGVAEAKLITIRENGVITVTQEKGP